MRFNFSISSILFSSFFLFFAFSANSQITRYVKPGGTGNGTSWEKASGYLQDMIDISSPRDAVWVAAGTYKPSKYPTGYTGPQNPRNKTFFFRNGAKIYGGFSIINPETTLEARNITTNVTILSGDIDNDDVIGQNGEIISGNKNNVYHVVLANVKDSGITVDGFSITGGYADEQSEIRINDKRIGIFSSLGGGIYTKYGTNTFTNNTLYNNSAVGNGGGIYTEYGTNIFTNNTLYNNSAVSFGGGICTSGDENYTNTFSDNTLYNNSAVGSGGGIYARHGTNILTNNVLYNNSTRANGGGIYTKSGTNTFTNNTLYNNSAVVSGGGICVYEGKRNQLINNIFWKNKKGTDASVVHADYYYSYEDYTPKSPNPPYYPYIIFQNNLLQLAKSNYTRENHNELSKESDNIFAQDPLFLSTTEGAINLGLKADSPCKMAGIIGMETPTTDIMGEPRIGTPDLGAYRCITSAVTNNNVLPNLQILKSGYPDEKEVKDKGDFFYLKQEGGATHKFIAKVISSKNIKDKLDFYMIKSDTAWKDNAKNVLVKKIIIYCDSLVLNENIWLPECNFEIHSRVINLQTFNLISSGLAYNESVDIIESKKGENGGNAGDMTITTSKVMGTGKFIANGGKGVSVFVPKVTIDYPKPTSKKRIEIYQRCNTTDGLSEGFSLGDNVVGVQSVIAENLRIEGKTIIKCTSYKSFDQDISYVDPGNITDKKGLKRITYDNCQPGKGGNNGKITFNTMTYIDTTLQCENSKSRNGIFLGRGKDDYADYGEYQKPFTNITIVSKEYRVEVLSVEFNNFIDNFWKRNHHQVSLPALSVNAELTTAINELAHKKEPSAGGFALLGGQPYIPNFEYLGKQIDFFQSQYFAYYKYKEEDKKVLNAQLQNFTNILKDYQTKVPDSLQQDWTSVYNSAVNLNMYKERSLDEFGNVPGYLPMYSLLQTLRYMKGNMKTDLKLFVMADILAQDEKQAKDFILKAPGIIRDLTDKNDDLFRKIIDENKVFARLNPQILECKILSDSISNKLKNLEKVFMEKAKKDAEFAKMWKTVGKVGLKVAAVASYAIPLPQPTTGQITSSILNTIGDNLNDEPEDIATKTLSKVDFSGVMEGLAQKKVKGIKPDSQEYYEGLTNKEKYEIDDKKYKKGVDELNKKYTERLEIGRDAIKDFSSISVSRDELDRRIANLKESSGEFIELTRDLNKQTVLKQEIFSKVSIALQRIGGYQSDILQNGTSIIKLQNQALKTEYSKDLDDAVQQIRNAALNRLKSAEYEMIKSFEYTTLTPYNNGQSMPCSKILEDVYNKKKGTLKLADVDDIVKELQISYIAQIKLMGAQIMNSADVKQYKDDGSYARNMILGNRDNIKSVANPYLDKLNEKKVITLDLQKDFGQEIIRPSNANIRIKDIQLNEMKFENPPANASLVVELSILDGGVLRKGYDFYRFRSGDTTGVLDTWIWNIKITNGKITIDPTERNEDFEDLLNFFNGDEASNGKSSDKKVSYFSSLPAWSRCKIRIINNAGGPAPKVTLMDIGLRCEFSNITDDKQTTLNVKTVNAPSSVLFSSIANKGKNIIFHTCDYYTVAQTNSEITLAINTRDTSVSNHFVEWQIIKNSKIIPPTKAKTITVTLDEHTIVKAVFDDGKIKPILSAPSAEKVIILYESPNANASILGVVYNLDECLFITDNEKDGYQRVAYKGMQEAFIKQE